MRGPLKILRMQRLRFANRTQAMDHAWRRLKIDSEHALRERYLGLRDKSLRPDASGEGERRTPGRSGRSNPGGSRACARAWKGLALKARLIHAADPARMLALGFSMLSTKGGRPVRSIAEITPDDVLVTRLRDGTVESRVISKKEQE